MSQGSNMHSLCSAVGGLAAVGTLLFTLYPTLLPARANEVVANMLPPLPAAADGVPFIGSAHVTGQVRLFLVAAALAVLLTAVTLAAGYYHILWREGRAFAMGRPASRRIPLLLLALPGLLCVVLGLKLAQTIFTPTNPTLLSEQLQLAAWAARSSLGGVVLGVILLLLAVLLAAAVFYLMVMLPRRVITGRMLRLVQ